MQRRTLKRFLSLPTCAGGDVAEVYAAIAPLDVLLHRLCAGTLVRMVSAEDHEGRLAYRRYLDSDQPIKDIRRKVSTWKSPFGVMLKAAQALGLPLFPRAKRVRHAMAKSNVNVNVPVFKNFNKKFSERCKKKAREFAESVIANIPSDEYTLYTDGGQCDDHKFAAVCGVKDNMESFTLCFRLTGAAVSSHVAEVYAIKAAILWSIKHDVKVHIVSDSQAAIRATLSPASQCIHARKVHTLLANSKVASLDWVPSHVGLPGNERADAIASGGDHSTIVRVPTSVSDYTNRIKLRALEIWNDRWKRSKNSKELHRLMPNVPHDRSHILGCITARIMARLRTGYCSVASFLHRHKLKDSNLCGRCLDVGKHRVETVAHFFVCKANRPHSTAVLVDFTAILGHRPTSLSEVLDVNLYLSKQINLANSIVKFVECTTEFCFL
mmetsp:Transcript_1998/g.3954  ORF Transcript_1998/g.3954 Transcript_1998/m.3954 type:complete len:438 (-) Transcript_1998:158-1471(-)